MLADIGLPTDEIEDIRKRFQDDYDGLTVLFLYIRAVMDDRHEYVD